jgi:hypothetical protein
MVIHCAPGIYDGFHLLSWHCAYFLPSPGIMSTAVRDIPDRHSTTTLSSDGRPPSLSGRPLPRPEDLEGLLAIPDIQCVLVKELPGYVQLRASNASIPRLRVYATTVMRKLVHDFDCFNRDLAWDPKEYALVLLVSSISRRGQSIHVACSSASIVGFMIALTHPRGRKDHPFRFSASGLKKA